MAIGYTSLPFARVVRARRLVWCVNGIPEERLLHRDDARQRLTVDAMWRSSRVGRRPDGAVVVSHSMADLLRERLGDVDAFVAPTVVDRSTFRPRPAGPGVLTYIGSGAPWQDLPLLADVWAAIHRLDPSRRFRVVSRDERAEVLVRALPADAVELVIAHRPAAVAEQLADTQLGFIVRRPHIVNTVSYPTKFGEYVASGVGVVTSDIGWEIADLVRSTGCGPVVDVDGPPERIAERVVAFLADDVAASGALTEACDRAAAQLDRTVFCERLGGYLADVVA
jgi:glycosyltransferase involved in cell wall biosynthesis